MNLDQLTSQIKELLNINIKTCENLVLKWQQTFTSNYIDSQIITPMHIAPIG